MNRRQRIIWNAAVLAIGIIGTVWSYLAAPAGGHYYVLWGAVVFGGFRLLLAVLD